jgi:hypothetical protein
VLLAWLLAGCGGTSQRDRLESYFGRVEVEQRAYRDAQRDALHALGLIAAGEPTRAQCRTSARLLHLAAGKYVRSGARLRKIEPPDALRAAHARLARSLQLYSLYLEEVQQVVGFCDALSLMAQAGSKLPDRAMALRSQWRRTVTTYAGQTDVALPAWADEVGRPPSATALQ